jgi:hypothetical protein
MDGGKPHRINSIIIVALLTVAVGGVTDVASASGARLRINVYDYARIEPHAIARAQALVTSIYRTIEIDACWKHPAGASQLQCHEPAAPGGRDLSILLLNSKMSERLGVADDVVGMAAVAAEGGGLVAYVLVDRVMITAKQEGVDPMSVLGLVIAHEIGHLMLPANAHSPTGLMRPRWNAPEFRAGAPSPHFTFTQTQADLIRRRLGLGTASAMTAQQASVPASPQSPKPSASMTIGPSR